MKRSYVVAAGFALALVAWVASGQLGAGREDGETAGLADPAVDGEDRSVAVRVREIQAEAVPREVIVNGTTAAARRVELRAEVAGRVVEVPVARGARVAEGDVLVRLDARDREAALAQAEAALAQREIEYDGARQLGQRGFQAETQVAASRAQLEAAKAAVAHARLELEHTLMRAPFAGVLERRPVEVGDFMEIGGAVATVIETDPFLVVGDVAETRVVGLRPGMRGEATLVDGRRVEGALRYVASEADANTRTFRIELEVTNPDGAFTAGMSARLRLLLPELPAHRVPASLLALDDTGQLGIKTVDDDGVVRFHAAEVIRADASAVWLAGLPERLRVITVGQGFVKDGERVRAVAEDAPAA